jgi:lysophospholipase L1-like esterase
MSETAGLRSVAIGISIFLTIFGALMPASAAPTVALNTTVSVSPSALPPARMSALPQNETEPDPMGQLATIEPRSGAIKVMVVGDSISHGHEGDWTWRYRLWEWFQSQSVAVDFVGPYSGTTPPEVTAPPSPPLVEGDPAAPSSPPRTNGGYAVGVSPDFDSDHFAVWGRQAAQAMSQIRGQIQTYSPDYLLIELGFNDIGWFVSDAAGTLASMKTLVDEARAAKPDIKFAIANVPQRTSMDGREDLPLKTDEYNTMLKNAIPLWSTATSPIALVRFRENYSCETSGCPAGYDGLHPNSLGEYQIAQAFSRTLYDAFQIGNSVLAIPASIPDRPTPIPSNFQATSSPQGVTVTWHAVYGALGYSVRNRLVGQTDWGVARTGMNAFYTTWTIDGLEWEYQVCTQNGDSMASAWTSIASAVSHPQTPSPPTRITTGATSTGIDISWVAPSGAYDSAINLYEVIIFDQDTAGAFIQARGVRGHSTHVDGLVVGHHYSVAIAAWNEAGGGIPGGARSVTIGAGTPPAPTNLQVTSTDPTTVQLDWCGSPEAAGYRVWIRNINNPSSVSEPSDTTSSTSLTTYGIAFLFPGVWNYEFCMTAINGAAESGKSNCVVAPKPGDAPVGGPVGGSGSYTGCTPSGGGSGSPTITSGPSPTTSRSSATTTAAGDTSDIDEDDDSNVPCDFTVSFNTLDDLQTRLADTQFILRKSTPSKLSRKS